MSREFIIFLHVHKCAGLTFKHILRRQFGPSRIARLRNRLSGKKPLPLVDALREVKRDDGYFAGHFGFGVHELLDFSAKYATFLRDPIKRLISLYEYSRSFPASYYHRWAKESTFGEFVTSGAVFETDNGLTRFLIGDVDQTDYFIYRKPFGTLDQNDLEIAIRNLKDRFATPGITEKFDESLLLLKDQLGLGSVRYLRINERGSNARMGTQWDNRLDAFVKWDRMLYDWALLQHKQKWEELLARQPMTYEAFAKANSRHQQLFQRPYSTYFAVKNRVLYGPSR